MKNTNYLRFLPFILALFLVPIRMSAEWQAPIQNFSPEDYNGGTQNWQLAEQHNSWLYAANNYGLLEFDGERWRLYGMASQMRSMWIGQEGEIYVGATNEFGVYHSDILGRMNYTSLSDSIPLQSKSFGEVWNICQLRGALYIQTRNLIIIRHTDGSFQEIVPKGVIHQMALSNDAIYVATTTGIYLLAGMNLNLLGGSDLLSGFETRGMHELPDGRMLIGTDLGGMFVYDGNKIVPYKSGIDGFIKKNQLYCFAVGDNSIAYGTVQDGVIVTDLTGVVRAHHNVQNGLRNNTVLSLLFSTDGSLWVGMDQGVAKLQLSSAMFNLRDDILSYGSGYCSAVVGSQMYFGTNQGLYTAAITDTLTMQLGALRFVEGSQGQVWNLCEAAGELLCCHNRGLFSVKKMRLKPVSTAEGFWNVIMRDENTAYAGTYSGICLLRKTADGWRVERKIQGHDDTSLSIEVDETGVIWTVSENGVTRLIPNADGSAFAKSETILPYNSNHDWYSISKIDGQVFISSNDTCCLVDRNGYVISAESLTGLLEGNRFYQKVKQDDNRNIWYIIDGQKKVLLYDASSHQFETTKRVITRRQDYVDGFPNICFLGKGRAVSGCMSGFYIIDVERLRNAASVHADLIIRRMRNINNGEVLYGEGFPAVKTELRLPYDKYNIRFEMGGVQDMSMKHQYFTRILPNEKEFTPCGESSYRDFMTEKYGKYTLEARMQSEQTGVVYTTKLQFEILPPWYKTLWAKILYVILGLLIFTGIGWATMLAGLRYKKILIARNEEKLRQQQQWHEKEAKEQEMRILQLEHERAMYELRSKSEKLNGLMLNQIGRNELIENVLTDLRGVQDDLNVQDLSGAQKRLQKLQQKLQRKEDKEIDWKRFEDNFDEANNRFMEKLGRMYPSLTKNERRLCVYIHMGLYTKEIAPLMGMGTRGVEMMRYRMRTKLGIEPQANLREFFASLAQEDNA